MRALVFGRPTRAAQPMRLDTSLNPHHLSPGEAGPTLHAATAGAEYVDHPILGGGGWSFDHLYSRPPGSLDHLLGGLPVSPTLSDGPVELMTHRMFDADGEWIVRIHSQVQHFAQLQRRIAVRIDSLGVPTRQMLVEMLEVAFWASLTSNEGRPTRVRIVMLRAAFPDDVLAFKHSMPYTEDEIAQLAPATSATAWLAVDMMEKPGRIRGISKKPIYDRLDAVTVEVTDPGTIRVGFGPFQSFVVFAGRSTTSPHGARDMALTARLRSALGKDLNAKGVVGSNTVWRECLALGFLARMVLEDRHGGTLLVVPTNTRDWIDSLVPFTHEFVQPDSSIRDSIRAALRQGASDGKTFATLDQSDASDDVKDAMFAALSQVNWYPEGVLCDFPDWPPSTAR